MSLTRILYVEDNALEAENTKRLYETTQKKFGGEAQFEVAPTWEDGVKSVQERRPDVVILDLGLPPSSGTVQTIEHIGEVSASWPPILVLTGNFYDLTLRRKCIMAGASDFMVKETVGHGGTERLLERVYNCHLRKEYEDAKRTRLPA